MLSAASSSPAKGNPAISWSVAAGLAVMVVLLILAEPQRSEALRMVIRATARTSLVLFMIAFSASGLVATLSMPWAQWVRHNRRQFGIGFALSHIVHLGAIMTLAWHDPALFHSLTTPASFIFGGSGYVVILAMLVTSFDGPARAIGAAAWRKLHSFGVWYLWLLFLVNFGKRVPAHPEYLFAVAIALVALAIRLTAMRRGERAFVR